MNSLKGHIKNVQVNGSLSLVTIELSDQSLFKAIIIETPETVSYLTAGHLVKVLFKETEVIIGKDTEQKISLQNRLKGEITHIERGLLLSNILINTPAGDISSIITTNAVDQLGLEEALSVCAMVKTNEIMLSE
ncbi:TOBE domain-containing protein [uncultured Eudoraea sp.]|uniref:TOBE domain-containing protein n=1 Tax=uncultured Eudoraea sp. TaxID=1035614 RepID=UPI00262A625F|nr:TOBE domain-containing protein [uncultured Eudoraea sp.]